VSDEGAGSRRTNFVESPVRPPQRSFLDRIVERASAVLRRLPVPLPVATAACALVAVLLVGLIVVRIVGSGSASADKVGSAAPTTAVAPATAPPATAIPTAPLPTRPAAEENAARRATFLDTMKSLGLTPKQAECAAVRVEQTIGWSQLSESILDPGKPGQLNDLMVACVKG
jgi:hypothetical protein